MLVFLLYSSLPNRTIAGWTSAYVLDWTVTAQQSTAQHGMVYTKHSTAQHGMVYTKHSTAQQQDANTCRFVAYRRSGVPLQTQASKPRVVWMDQWHFPIVMPGNVEQRGLLLWAELQHQGQNLEHLRSTYKVVAAAWNIDQVLARCIKISLAQVQTSAVWVRLHQQYQQASASPWPTNGCATHTQIHVQIQCQQLQIIVGTTLMLKHRQTTADSELLYDRISNS